MCEQLSVTNCPLYSLVKIKAQGSKKQKSLIETKAISSTSKEISRDSTIMQRFHTCRVLSCRGTTKKKSKKSNRVKYVTVTQEAIRRHGGEQTLSYCITPKNTGLILSASHLYQYDANQE